MIEIVVAIVLLTVGALGYAVVTANLARAFFVDSRRSRAGELLDSEREALLRQTCSQAASGASVRFGMPVEWDVSSPGGSTRNLAVVVTRPGSLGSRRDTLLATLPCS